MKKALALVLAALLLVSMAACTGTAPAATTAATTAAATETTAAAETEASEASAETESGKTYTVGICQLVQHPALDAATQGFKDALTEALGDAVSFNEQNASGESVNCATIVNGLVASQVDLILACCHWGIEKDTYPENYQQVLGRKCIDWGVDLVIGHHPHVLQGIEEYKGRYIIYSLANFCFGANRNPADKDTMIFQQTFTFENGQKVEDRNARIIPCMVSSVSTRNDFKPTPAAGEDKKRILQRMNEYSRDFGVEFDENGGILVN